MCRESYLNSRVPRNLTLNLSNFLCINITLTFELKQPTQNCTNWLLYEDVADTVICTILLDTAPSGESKIVSFDPHKESNTTWHKHNKQYLPFLLNLKSSAATLYSAPLDDQRVNITIQNQIHSESFYNTGTEVLLLICIKFTVLVST